MFSNPEKPYLLVSAARGDATSELSPRLSGVCAKSSYGSAPGFCIAGEGRGRFLPAWKMRIGKGFDLNSSSLGGGH